MSSIGNGIWYGQRTTASAVVGRMLAQSQGTSRLVRTEGVGLAIVSKRQPFKSTFALEMQLMLY